MQRRVFLVLLWITIMVPGARARDASLVPALVRAHVEAMELVKPCLLDLFKLVECHDVWDILDGTEEKTLPPAKIPALIAVLEELDASLASAAVQVAPLLAADQDAVATAAERIAGAYRQLAETNRAILTQLRSFGGKNATEEQIQKIAEQVGADTDRFIADLYFSSDWVEVALTQAFPDPDRNGYPPAERAEMLARLAALFGPIQNQEAGISLTEGYHFRNAVVALYEALKTKEPSR